MRTGPATHSRAQVFSALGVLPHMSFTGGGRAAVVVTGVSVRATGAAYAESGAPAAVATLHAGPASQVRRSDVQGERERCSTSQLISAGATLVPALPQSSQGDFSQKHRRHLGLTAQQCA